MTQEHPITPPPELVTEWWNKCTATSDNLIRQFATQAARWGSDQELEACCEWLAIARNHTLSWEEATNYSANLRHSRRSKPPSLKDKALLQLDTLNADLAMHGMGCDLSQIRRALESLPD